MQNGVTSAYEVQTTPVFIAKNAYVFLIKVHLVVDLCFYACKAEMHDECASVCSYRSFSVV